MKELNPKRVVTVVGDPQITFSFVNTLTELPTAGPIGRAGHCTPEGAHSGPRRPVGQKSIQNEPVTVRGLVPKPGPIEEAVGCLLAPARPTQGRRIDTDGATQVSTQCAHRTHWRRIDSRIAVGRCVANARVVARPTV